MAGEQTARKSAPDTPVFRAAPHNIEAEQALLGAILVNNEAFYRVSDFLEPAHFFEPIHAEDLRARREPDPRRQGRDPGHAQDVPAGRSRRRRPDREPVSRAARGGSDHRHQRRGLRPHHLRSRHPPLADHHRRGHGQRRLRRAGRSSRRASRSRTPSGGSTNSPRPAATTAASSASRPRSPPPSTWRRSAYQRDGKLSGLATGLARPRPHDGRAADLRPGHPRRPSRHGQDRARHQHRLQHRQGLARRGAARRAHRNGQRRHRRLLLARNVGRAARDPHHRRADRDSVVPHPARRDRSVRLRPHRPDGARDGDDPALHRRDRRPLDRAAHRARAAAQAPARARPAGRSTISSCCPARASARRKAACRK